MWSKRKQHTFQEALKLADLHDFLVLLETRENKSRKNYTEAALPEGYTMYSTEISARKGGVAIFIKKAFLNKFTKVEWTIFVEGRIARLTLDGPGGRLCIFAIYLDPSSIDNQISGIQCIGREADPSGHNILAGDFNFVEAPTDRIAKHTADPSKQDDRRQSERWKQCVRARDFQEFYQPNFTCENSHGWSKIDRVYSDLHAASLVCSTSFCTVLGHRRHLSDHSPISFGLQNKRSKQHKAIPAWVVADGCFADEATNNMAFLTKRHNDESNQEPTSFQQLDILKFAISDAVKFIRTKTSNAIAATNAHKLACTLGFIRAIESDDMQQASRFQRKYARLQCDQHLLCRTSGWYKQVKDHAVDLMHSDIGERVLELKQTKETLPADIYERRKNGIARRLKQLIPAGTANELSIIKDAGGHMFTDKANIARILTEHWQSTFNMKPTDDQLRGAWLERIRNRFKADLDDLQPTDYDIDNVFSNLRDSASGPDGISTGIYMHLEGLAKPIFKQLVRDLIDGTAVPTDDFNLVFLCCIPKDSKEKDSTGASIHSAATTRPLSIVDAANRIVAAILCASLERCVGQRISSMQRGFVKGRQMLMNIIDVDTAAQTISIKSNCGAVILFDFKAAFPSMDHSFIWHTLRVGGIPSKFISAIQALYKHNHHQLRLDGQLYDGPTVRSGVRQGCPLSGLLFSICVDVLLLRLSDVLIKEDELARAFADDTATAVNDYMVAIPTLASLFHEFEQISGLQLNIDKTVFIPLWPVASERGLRNLITEVCPSWRNIKISSRGKYLGFIIGPGTKGDSWNGPLAKFAARVKIWEGTKYGLFWNSLYYNTFVVPTLEFVAQLELVYAEVVEAETRALRKLAPGQGTWISAEDQEHLGLYGIGNGFRSISHTARAAKLRLLHSLGGTYCRHRKERILVAQSNYLRRPFGIWHNRGYAIVLCDNEDALAALSIQRRAINIHQSEQHHSFQKAARKLIVARSMSYSMEERVRKKAKRWKFKDPLNHVTNRIINLFNAMRSVVPPAVRASYLRALWNGIPTNRRMASMDSFKVTNCVFNCSRNAADSTEHYCHCPRLRDILGATCGHLTQHPFESIDDLFGVGKGLSMETRLGCARRLHVALRVIHFARQFGYEQDLRFIAGMEASR